MSKHVFVYEKFDYAEWLKRFNLTDELTSRYKFEMYQEIIRNIESCDIHLKKYMQIILKQKP
jgi:hypothetical protein